MRYSREHKQETHARIVRKASVRLREKGAHGVGVADLMKEAGLTHGGFYGHFESKEDLMAQACERAFERSIAKWARVCAQADGKPVSAIAKSYLSTRHRDDPGRGCAVATLGAESSRHGPKVRHAIGEGVRALVDILSGTMPGKNRAAKRRMVLVSFAGMVGAVVLARAVHDAELSEEILDAVSASIDAAAA
jgi:TetR/AcrR family transcriptional regulator, transcriptional repressor for nem operon